MAEPRPKLSLRILMVAIAYVAIGCAGGVATINDRSRPDVFTCCFALGIIGHIVPRLMAGRGRNLAAYWGFALTSLVALTAVLLFFEMTNLRVEATSSILRMLGLNFGLPWLAVLAGYLGAWFSRRRFDQRHPEPVEIEPARVS